MCRCSWYTAFAALTLTCFLLGSRAEVATTATGGPYLAFVMGHSHVPFKTPESTRASLMPMTTKEDEYHGTSRAYPETTRRLYIKRSFIQASSVMGTVATAPWNKAEAATVTTTEPQEVVLPSCLCDPTVSSWQKDKRTVHIVGTSHISSISADLARNVVREVQPDCLFIELDLTRIDKAFQGGQPMSGLKLGYWDKQGNLRVGTTLSRPRDPISWLEQGISQLVQGQGLLAGEEMINSVQEAFNIGATVVLGDRDFGVSMRRLADASKTADIRKLFEANRIFLKEEVPESLKPSSRASKEDVRDFVETLKTKEMVDKLMGTWKTYAPEAYTVMIEERNEYMSIGLDDLSVFQTVVAVMGLAHVDGVTKNLATMGWRRIRQPKCSPITRA